MKIFVNGRMVDEGKAVISVFDRGLLYGDGIFETMRSYSGQVASLDRHLDRLFASGTAVGITVKFDRRYLKFIIYKLLKLNGLRDAYIRLAITRGCGRVGLDANTAKDQTLIVIVKKFTPYPERLYKKGVSLFISSVRRNERSPLCGIKSLNYLNNIMARIEAQKGGADDALLLNTKGDVTESAVSNIFMIKGKKLITPSLKSGLLAGVTREIILSLAGECGLDAVEKRVKPQDLKKANEVFLTNTLMEVMPVVKIDGKKIGKGRPGSIAKKIHKCYTSNII